MSTPAHDILLSILLPTRNRPESLQYAIESLRPLLDTGRVELVIASNGKNCRNDFLESWKK